MKKHAEESTAKKAAALTQAEEQQDKAILLGLILPGEGEAEAEASLDELTALAETAGLRVLGRVTQRRLAPDAGTAAGEGKAREVQETAAAMGATTLLYDGDLTGSQMKNLADLTGLQVLDRTLLILDIFAARANSAEGVLQVEIAQLEDRLTRLTGSSDALSRLGGGIGTRGPGESRLESDRRHIRRRIALLRRQLKELSARRDTLRGKREERAYTVAVCGYTNAGKSSLINALCASSLLAEDKLFATLDPAARRLPVDGPEILLVDTVGFIRRLPHQLVDAFRSTLDEVRTADLILQVTDLSDPAAAAEAELVDSMLNELGAGRKPRLHLLNKIDCCQIQAEAEPPIFFRNRLDAPIRELPVSARTGEGLEAAQTALLDLIKKGMERRSLLLPYKAQDLLPLLRRSAFLEKVEYQENGLSLTLLATPAVYGRLARRGVPSKPVESPAAGSATGH